MAALAPMAASAADKIVYGPQPAWVLATDPQGAPAATTNGEAMANPPVEILVSDTQSKFSADTVSDYAAVKARVKTSEGLALGAIAREWDPATDTLSVHKLQVIRDGQVIDVLRKQKFEILRRERSLEQSMLDGRLTATLQIADLRVGDVVDYAMTITRAQPVMAGRNSTTVIFGPRSRVEQARVRYVWDRTAEAHWRVGDALPKPKTIETPGGGEMLFEASGLVGPTPPLGAPSRFAFGGVIEASQLDNWPEVSAAFQPLFAQASRLAPNSPIRAEAEKIKREASTPQARASLALKLVQDQIRYLAITMNAQGYTPAAADETWKRRFGDCKGKTALLLALLRELGIDAAPALVETESGEALSAILPRADAFDHVIVRAEIDGKVYWLDGTGVGDGPIETLLTPDYGWALPLTAPGSGLERLHPARLQRPNTQLTFRLDASGGFDKEAPAQLEVIETEIAAGAIARALAAAPKSEVEQSLIQKYDNRFARTRFTEAHWRYDEKSSRIITTLKGMAAPDVQIANGYKRFDIPGSEYYAPDLKPRPKEQDQAAPYAVDDTNYTRWLTVVRLPKGAADSYALYGAPLYSTLGGLRTTRWAAKEGDEVTMLFSERGVTEELTAGDLARDAAIARRMQSSASIIASRPTTTEARNADGSAPKDVSGPDDLLTSGGANRLTISAYTLEDGQRARYILGRENPEFAVVSDTISTLAAKNDLPGLLKLFDTTKVDLSPLGDGRWMMRAGALKDLKRDAEALGVMDDAIDKSPSATLYVYRAGMHGPEENKDKMRADLEAALALEPDNLLALNALVNLMGSRTTEKDKVLELRRRIARLQPDEPETLILLSRAEIAAGNLVESLQALQDAHAAGAAGTTALTPQATLLARLKRYDEANAVLNEAVGLRPDTASVLNSACWERALMNLDLAKAQTECERAVALQPGSIAQRDSLAFVKFRRERYADAIKDYDAILATAGSFPASQYGRGLAKLRLGQTTEGEADIAAARKLAPRVSEEFEAFGIKP